MTEPETERCYKCGRPCKPVFDVYSQKKKRSMPLCGACAELWAEEGEMPP